MFLKLDSISETVAGQLLNTVATQSEQTVNIGQAKRTTCTLLIHNSSPSFQCFMLLMCRIPISSRYYLHMDVEALWDILGDDADNKEFGLFKQVDSKKWHQNDSLLRALLVMNLILLSGFLSLYYLPWAALITPKFESLNSYSVGVRHFLAKIKAPLRN